MATWALFDQSKRWIASSQDENGAEYYNVNIAGNTVTYGLLRKTLMVEELLEQYPGTAYIVLSTNNHADYEAKMDINNVNFGWSSEKQYITLRSVASGPETDIPQNVVLYVEQTLTGEQQAQARENIGILEPLVGSTDDITPEQVIEAVQEGRDISLSHTDETYGPIIFSSFLYIPALEIVLSSGVFAIYYPAEKTMRFTLYGNASQNNVWGFEYGQIANYEDIADKLDADKLPEAINTALAQAKESGAFDGPMGPAYMLTDEDRTAIVNAVVAALPVYNGEVAAE